MILSVEMRSPSGLRRSRIPEGVRYANAVVRYTARASCRGSGRIGLAASVAPSRVLAWPVRRSPCDGAGRYARVREQRLVALDLLGPVACERFEEVLADAGPEVDGARPDRAGTGLARGARRRPASCSGRRRGRGGSAPSRRRRRCLHRRARGSRAACSTGGAVPGSVVRHTRSSSVGRETYTLDRDLARCGGEDVDITHDERPARDDRERRARRDELGDACAGEPELSLGGLVGVGRGAERDLLSLPRPARELTAQHLRDVRLHADRAAVAVVGGTIGALLEVPDVAERAPVHAAHVRVERPPERHPADLRQRRLARLDPVLDPHRSRIEHMFDATARTLESLAMDELVDGIRRVTLPLPDAAGARARVPPARRRRLDARRHGRSGSPTRRRRGRSSSRRQAGASRPSSSPTSIPTTSGPRQTCTS